MDTREPDHCSSRSCAQHSAVLRRINGRDELSIAEKVRLDVEYLQRPSLVFDLKILLLTAHKVMRREGGSH
ncbi:sugar transferase [Noviherbaspirillum malthae]|uniref:sugar transferase n=1 Tax=Noviherbaspirillum malthae TaxID=1260987 RepID=UPI002B27AF82|nr:sugar transferase [Noviherbaspirillum malthae]